MWSTAREIAAGDVVIFWQTRDLVLPITITPGKDYNSKFGYYRHSDLIGVPYGSKMASRNGKGFLHVLRPTPELWTLALPHRTQILYLADIAFISAWLDLRPGAKVIEAGTGSGSFSHSIARTVAPSGHLWSYEYHEKRANQARIEFDQHGMNDFVTLTHRNVCKDGFTVMDTVDAVFLDLPAPWEAIDHAKKALRKDKITRICCFSPCMEQVLRTVSALNAAGFTDVTMYETLQRPHDVSSAPPLPSISEASAKLKLSEIRRADKRLKQIASNPRTAEGRLGAQKRKHEADVVDQEEEQASEAGLERKRVKKEDADDEIIKKEESPVELAGLEAQNEQTLSEPSLPIIPKIKVSASKAIHEVRGHTSYLTFACLLPLEVTNQDTKIHPVDAPAEFESLKSHVGEAGENLKREEIAMDVDNGAEASSL